MTGRVTVDTNVPIVANGGTPQAGPECVTRCIDALLQLREGCVVVLDRGGLILAEYRRYLSPAGAPGAGDLFLKWLWDNSTNPLHCAEVNLTADPMREFLEFPDDPDLATFDRNDRKFAAALLSGGNSGEVLNASDADWWHHRVALERHGVKVHFLCPELMTPAD